MIAKRDANCRRYSADLASYLDATLAPDRKALVATHLAECAECSAEVRELQHLKASLGAATPGQPTAALESRLVSIAGTQHDAPLWLSGKSQPRLPSRRARRRKALGVSAAAGASLLTFVLVLALMVSPELKLIDDPTSLVEQDYIAAEAALGLSPAVAVVLAAQRQGIELPRVAALEPALVAGRKNRIPAEQAEDALAEARTVEVVGRQRVGFVGHDGSYQAQAVVTASSLGTKVTLLDDAEGALFDGTVQAGGQWDSTVIETGYEFFSYADPTTVGGLRAWVFEAQSAGEKVARWWIGDDGALLWSERFSITGELCLQVGFVGHLPESAEVIASSVSVEVIEAAQPASASQPAGCFGWSDCPLELAGMPLVSATESGTVDAPILHLTYSNGVTTVCVVRETGLLDHPGTFERLGLLKERAWQSGTAVVSVATNGSEALLDLAAAQLPHDSATKPDLFWRFKAGLVRLFGDTDS